MFAGTKWHDLPGRVVTGLYILNSGLTKRQASPEMAAGVHGMAAGAYPFLKSMEPEKFVRRLSTAEITVGSLLLTPLVPTKIAATALAAFSGGLVTLYMRTPSLRREGSIRPSQAGVAIAKDSWLLGLSIGYLMDVASRGRRRADRSS